MKDIERYFNVHNSVFLIYTTRNDYNNEVFGWNTSVWPIIHQIKASEQWMHVVLVILLYKVVPAFF